MTVEEAGGETFAAELLRVLAAALLFLAAIVAWGYAWWAATLRREMFVHIGDDVASVTRTAAERSDATDDLLLWVGVGVSASALVCWLVTELVGRLVLGAVGFTALALIVVGAGVAAGGAYLTSLVQSTETADRAVLGYLLAGSGWAMIGLGLATGAASLLVADRRLRAGQAPRIGYAAWVRR